MATAFIGNLLNSNIKTVISASTSTGQTSGANQVLPSSISANTTLGSGNYTYQWSQSGTAITFTTPTSSSTNCTYASLSVAGSTTIFCTVTDTWTGVRVTSGNCVITWPVQSIPITSVTWSIASNTNSVYNGAAQSVTVVSVVPVGATYTTSTTTATNAGSVASTTITGSGAYTGSFTSPTRTITTSTITLASSGSTNVIGTGATVSVGYTVSGVYAADTNYSVSEASGIYIGVYTATLSETSSNYTLGSPNSFNWSIIPDTLNISLSTINIPNIKGDPIYYIQYYRYNGPNTSQTTVNETWSSVTTTDFALPLQVWTTSPNGWGAEPKTVNIFIYNTPYFYNYSTSRPIPS